MNPSLRSRTSFDFDWKFAKGDPRGASSIDFDDRRWLDVTLPHDWSIAGPFSADAPGWGAHGWALHGVGWYRKSVDLPAADSNRTFWIEFDGVYHNSDVYLNGRHIGRRDYGYSSFRYDLTPHLNFGGGGSNVIAVRVDNSDVPNCRWYSGSGIYRHAWLTKVSSAAHVAHWGTYVTTPRVSARSATVRVRTRVVGGPGVELSTTIHDPAGRAVASRRDRRRGMESDQSFTIPRRQLWSVEQPVLYCARSIVHMNGRAVDDVVTFFGIRSIRIDSVRGLLLNERRVKLKGVCLHHDAGCVGAAVPDRVLRRRLEILQELGCNAIRCSHNPPAPELLDLCDRMGLLVIDEAFDKWAGDFAKPGDWWMRQRGFADNWQQDLSAMLERDRNHPCVVMWSVGNETGYPGTSQVNPMLRRLVKFVRGAEPTRPVTVALVNSNAKTPRQRVRRVLSSAKMVDVAGLNYQEPLFPLLRKADRKIVLCASESFKYWRGGEMDVRVYDPRNPWYDAANNDYVIGQFLWPGFDYLGESNRWPLKGWNTGILDTRGFLKPEGWFHRSVWRSEPMVRIAILRDDPAGAEASPWAAPAMAEHWNLPAAMNGKLVRVATQTNCETVELKLNGRTLGRRRAADFLNASPLWFVPYAAGTIEAIGRRGGKVAARHVLHTSGPASRVELVGDRTTIRADGQDVAHVEMRLLDKAGVPVPDDDRLVRFRLAGPATILGVDNGDLESLEPYQGSARTTRGGRLLVIVRSERKAGTIRLTATARGLRATAISLRSR